jgi:hypothetical protein
LQAGGQEFDPPQLHQIAMGLRDAGSCLKMGTRYLVSIFEQRRKPKFIAFKARQCESIAWMFDNEIDLGKYIQG